MSFLSLPSACHYSVGGPPGQPPRQMILPSGKVTTPAAIAVPPSLRVGLPSILTFLPINSSTFHPAFFALTAPVRAVMRQVSTPPGFSTSTTISEWGLISLNDFTTPSIWTVLDISKNVLNE